jgi:hypothetical protein
MGIQTSEICGYCGLPIDMCDCTDFYDEDDEDEDEDEEEDI